MGNGQGISAQFGCSAAATARCGAAPLDISAAPAPHDRSAAAATMAASLLITPRVPKLVARQILSRLGEFRPRARTLGQCDQLLVVFLRLGLIAKLLGRLGGAQEAVEAVRLLRL